jgi:hypothetical protein
MYCFFWFKQLKKKPSNIEVYAFVYEQFYPKITLNAGDIKKEIEFYQLLATKLPADFMLNCTRTDLTKWFEFYLLNPYFFEQLDANQKIENGFEFFISLFKNFKISGALLACFYAGENHRTELDFQEKQWFVSVLNGESIRKQSNLPCVISKKAAHVFLNLPANADLSIKQALIYSALIAKDVKADFAQIIAKRIYIYDNIDFWIETLSILFHKGLLKSTLFEVMDYINHQVIVNKRAINFKTKKINNLNFEVWEWHEQLRVEKDFKKIGFKKFTISQVDEFRFRKGEIFYRIKQLKNTKELFLEAQKMQHCVLSYTNLCRRNICTIYSLTQSSENEDLNHLITIEVRNNTIVQMRGYKNRAVQSDEKEIIALWANENSLQIA